MYFILFFSLLIGSFLNVCICRIPNDQSIAFPPSHCTSCEHRLGAMDLIPLLSFVFLRGKCRYCKSTISIKYPLVELTNALFYMLLYLKFGLTLEYISYAILSSILIIIFFIDLDHQIIPDSLVIAILVISILPIARSSFSFILSHIYGLLFGGGLFLIIAVVTNGAMGGGDIKLMGALGLFFGLNKIIFITVISFILGAVISVILISVKLKSRKDYIPFGPFIAVATLICIFYYMPIVNLYIKFLIGG